MGNDKPKIYRRRYIPDEKILLKDDVILQIDADTIVTRWDTLKPRADIAKGISIYFLKDGIKVSKVFSSENKLVYYYCDIIETVYEEESNAIVFNDLLADVLVYEDGFVKVVDIAEIADALDENLISLNQAKACLRSLDYLLIMIYNGQFAELVCKFNDYK